jgi:tetratricopeptide (TPR) repeat protein
MSRKIKLVLYIICAIGVIVFGALTAKAFRGAGKTAEKRAERIASVANTETTNAAVEITNAIPDTNAAAATNIAVEVKKDSDETPAAGVSTRNVSRMVTYGLGFIVFFIGLAALIAYDVSHVVAAKAYETLFNDNGKPDDPEYEKAEQMWTNGQYLDAVRAMREYLERNPREQYVALRIAEIYDENLNNPLAAALEYEEVLKKKLPRDRWGWAAIRLANIYSGKLGKPDQSIAILRRIDAECGQTPAANKARERLLQIDPDFVPTPQPAEEVAAEAPPEETPARPSSNLPPGFRPKD